MVSAQDPSILWINLREAVLVCVENRGTTSGSISLNGSWVVAPSEFKGAPALIAHSVTLKLGDNSLIGAISGPVGQSFTVRVYGR